MEVDVVPGPTTWWPGAGPRTRIRSPFRTGRPASREWTATLNRDHASGEAFVREDLDRLYHGYLPAQLFAKAEEGVFTYTMPLTKDTNNVRVVLQRDFRARRWTRTVSSSGSRPRTAAWTGTTDCCPTSWSPITPGTSSRERPASTCPTCPARSPR
ncbi:MAG: FimB/Mfa2 family fimbrial subunit [Alistipes indistinctus]